MQCLKDSLGYLGSLLAPPTGHHGRPRPVPGTDDASHLQPKLPGAGGAEVDFPDGDDAAGVLNHWALLVAGSSGWGNYRHQSDVAHDPQNPFPGKLYNRPGGTLAVQQGSGSIAVCGSQRLVNSLLSAPALMG